MIYFLSLKIKGKMFSKVLEKFSKLSSMQKLYYSQVGLCTVGGATLGFTNVFNTLHKKQGDTSMLILDIYLGVPAHVMGGFVCGLLLPFSLPGYLVHKKYFSDSSSAPRRGNNTSTIKDPIRDLFPS
jgi:hypothetical protein